MAGLCVFWQRASWQSRPSALGKNPLPVSFRPEKQRQGSRPFTPRSPSLTGNERHLRTSTRLGPQSRICGKKIPKTPVALWRSCSSLLGVLCFSLVPLFPRQENVFIRWQTVRLPYHWIIFTGQLQLERARGKCRARRKHHKITADVKIWWFFCSQCIWEQQTSIFLI